MFLQQEVALKALGTEGLFLFSSLDTDHDLYLSPEEFKLVAEKLTGSPPAFFCTLTHSNPKYSIPTNPTQMLTNSHWFVTFCLPPCRDLASSRF